MVFLLDTSALIKLYHKEAFSEELRTFLSSTKVSKLLITNLAQLEFAAAIWGKMRNTQDQYFDKIRALAVLQIFENDQSNFEVVFLENTDFDASYRLINRLNAAGLNLRAPDALQLTVAHQLMAVTDGFICFDKKLSNYAQELGIKVVSGEDF